MDRCRLTSIGTGTRWNHCNLAEVVSHVLWVPDLWFTMNDTWVTWVMYQLKSKDREYSGLHVGSGRTQLSKNPWKILFSKVLTRPPPSGVYNPFLIQSHVALETAQGSEFQSWSSSSAFFLRSQRNFRKSPQLTLLTLLTLNQTRTVQKSPRKPKKSIGIGV